MLIMHTTLDFVLIWFAQHWHEVAKLMLLLISGFGLVQCTMTLTDQQMCILLCNILMDGST